MFSNTSNFQSSFSSPTYGSNTANALYNSNKKETNAFGDFSSSSGPKLSQNSFGKQDKKYEVTVTQAREKFQSITAMEEYKGLSFEEMCFYHMAPKTTSNFEMSPMGKQTTTLGFSNSTPDINQKLQFGGNQFSSPYVDSNASTPVHHNQFSTPNQKGLGINVFEDSVLTPSAFGNNSFSQNTSTAYTSGRRSSTVRKNTGRGSSVALNFGDSENIKPNTSFNTSTNYSLNQDTLGFASTPNDKYTSTNLGFSPNPNPNSNSILGNNDSFGGLSTSTMERYKQYAFGNMGSTAFGSETKNDTSNLGFNSKTNEISGFGVNSSFQPTSTNNQSGFGVNTSIQSNTYQFGGNSSENKSTGFGSSSQFGGKSSSLESTTTKNTSSFGTNSTNNTSSFGTTTSSSKFGFGAGSSILNNDTSTPSSSTFGFGSQTNPSTTTSFSVPSADSKSNFGEGIKTTSGFSSTTGASSTENKPSGSFGALSSSSTSFGVSFGAPTTSSSTTTENKPIGGFGAQSTENKPNGSFGVTTTSNTTFGFGASSEKEPKKVTFGSDVILGSQQNSIPISTTSSAPPSNENKINVQFGTQSLVQPTAINNENVNTQNIQQPTSNLNLSILDNPYGKTFFFNDFINEKEEYYSSTKENIIDKVPFYHPIPLINVNRIRKKKKVDCLQAVENITEMFNTTIVNRKEESQVYAKIEFEEKRIVPKREKKKYPILTKEGYSFEPSLKKLRKMDLTKVRNFTVSREGFGSVKFLGETNVENLNLDEIINIDKNSVTVYPDDSNKPKIGFGLNKAAIINLVGVFPSLKKCQNKIRQASTFVQNEIFIEKLKKINQKSKSIFLHYSKESGEWIFKVENF
eukprot:gene3890-7103_t